MFTYPACRAAPAGKGGRMAGEARIDVLLNGAPAIVTAA